MKPLQLLPMHQQNEDSCTNNTAAGTSEMSLKARLLIGVVLFPAWFILYGQLHTFSTALTKNVLDLDLDSRIGSAVQFFLYDTPKILMLLSLVIFGVGILRTFITPERSRSFLVGKNLITAHILASIVGIVTPFCTCSAIPLFIGFVTAGIPLGVTFSYLIAAPMINEIALIMLYGLLGWKVAVLYVTTGLAIAILAGMLIGRLNLEHLVEDWVQENLNGIPLTMTTKLSWNDRITQGIDEVKSIVGKVWIYIVGGIAVGAIIHGFVPEGAMAAIMGKDAWWSVPAAVVLGVPMYSSAAGMIPVVQALLGKGAALGTALAFMMSVIALSLPEILILRKVLKPRLIAVFVSIVAGGILLVGTLFNAVI